MIITLNKKDLFVSDLVAQIWRFLVTGGISFLFDFLVLLFCVEVLHLHYLLSASFGFFVGVTINFILSIKWVFNLKEGRSKKIIFIPFVILSLCGLLLTNGIMWIGVEYLSMHYIFMKIVATGVAMVFNFLSRKILIEKI